MLVTSWNWLYLADFASFKPTYIPYDDPSDFSFFFDTGGRRRCYVAPEVCVIMYSLNFFFLFYFPKEYFLIISRLGRRYQNLYKSFHTRSYRYLWLYDKLMTFGSGNLLVEIWILLLGRDRDITLSYGLISIHLVTF